MVMHLQSALVNLDPKKLKRETDNFMIMKESNELRLLEKFNHISKNSNMGQYNHDDILNLFISKLKTLKNSVELVCDLKKNALILNPPFNFIS
ncbi:hypothetical protein HZS_4503 [Henneguya salminicola]|nr:hypothetical protein HZS_4503 [Henneguya salminicola]